METMTAAQMNEPFRRCGEITTSVTVDKKIYALNCIFCSSVSYQLDAFVLHIEEQHGQQLFRSMLIPEEEEEQEQYYSDAHAEEKEFFIENETECVEKTDEENSFVTIEKLEDVPIELSTEKDNCTNHVKSNDQRHFQDPLEELPTDESENNGDYTKEGEQYIEEMSDTNDNEDDQHEDSNDNVLSETESSEYCDKNDSDGNYDCNDTESISDPKELTSALIACYEKHRLLWDNKESMSKNRKKRDDALKKIASSINKELGYSFKAKNISERITKLRYKFRSELQNQKLAEAKGEMFVPSWYFSKLGFLNKSIKYKQRNKRGTKALANEKPALPITNLSDEQNLHLIDIYKSYPCLWDVQHIGFRFKKQRQEALEEMLEAIKEKMDFDYTQDSLQKKLYRIRYACTQEKHRKLQCEQNGEVFSPTCKYYKEIRFLEDNVGPFKCSYCEETFNGADQFKIHKSKHDNSMPFTCPICNRGFMKVGNCTVHLRRHTRDYPFECKVCGKRYATSTDVNVHMRYHTGEKPYFCEICGQSFRTWTFFDAHMRRHQKRPNHKCTICSKSFYENNKLSEHMKGHLNLRDKVCNVCGKAFTSSKYLRQHKQIHAEKKKYVCKICGKDFAQYAGLSGHMKTHGTTVTGTSLEDNH